MALLEDLGVRGVDRSELSSFLSVGFPWHEHAVSHERLFAGCSYWDYMGGLFQKVVDRFIGDAPGAGEVGIRIRKWVLSHHAYEATPHCREVLHDLTGKGYTHVVASNHIPELRKLLRDVNLEDCFAEIYTSGAIGFEKPNPEFFSHILSREDSSQIICMVGDNYVCDYLGARAAGLQAVWFDRSPEHPSPGDCKDRICCLSELPAIVERARLRRRSKGCG